MSSAEPNPAYWRMVHSRSRYIDAYGPRVYGGSPGWPSGGPGSSGGPYQGSTGIPESVVIIGAAVQGPVVQGQHARDDLPDRRAHAVDGAHAQAGQGRDVLGRDRAPDHQRDVIHPGRLLCLADLPGQRDVHAGQDRDADHVGVLGLGRGDDLPGGLAQPEVDDLGAGVAQRHRDDLHAAVMAVQPRFGQHDSHRLPILSSSPRGPGHPPEPRASASTAKLV